MTNNAPQFLIVDDDPLVPDYVRNMIIQSFPGAECIFATTVEQALSRLQEFERPFRAVLLDYLLPDGTGMEVLAALRAHPNHKGAPALLVSGMSLDSLVLECRVGGAQGYIWRNNLPTCLVPALRAVLSGQEYFTTALDNSGGSKKAEAGDVAVPTKFEPIARRLANGQSTKQIATDLAITEVTVRNALPELMRLLSVANRGELIRALAEHYRANG